MTANPENLLRGLRREAIDAPGSGIVGVMNYGRDRDGLIALWAGEGDVPTPQFICEAAAAALHAGETFYTHQRGIPALREALARYHARLYARAFSPERFFVTGSGMQAIQIAIRMVAGAGDEVVVPMPAWPNIAAALGIQASRVTAVPMVFEETGWRLDLDRLFAACGDRTRALFINSPSNPTGWTATTGELSEILAFARHRGLWIIADEVYGRFFFSGPRAPSFHDIAEEEDRIIHVNSFSKNWAMTGWRLGWLAAPPQLGETVENLIQYSTSGVPAFLQRGAVVALDDGEPFLAEQVARARAGRDIICAALKRSPRIRYAPPQGAFYLFFAIEGEADTSRLGLRLVDEANIGVAPGTAFGEAGRGHVRLCFARRPDGLRTAAERLLEWLRR